MLRFQWLNQLLLKMLMILNVGDDIDCLCENQALHVDVGAVFVDEYLVSVLAHGMQALQLVRHKLRLEQETRV